MRKLTLVVAMMSLGLGVAPAMAGSWVCGEGCDAATLKGIKWVPGGTKCPKPAEPEINTKTPKAYNESANNTNNWINGANGYFQCLNEELNGDFTSAQGNMNESAKAYFEEVQSTFKARVDEISKQLDEGLKKLNKK